VHSTLKRFLWPALGLVTLCAPVDVVHGDVAIDTLISFNFDNGSQPSAGLVQGPDGAFYGTTQYGGSYKQGTVFKITSSGTFSNLLSFSGVSGPYPGANPAGDLIPGANGVLYGTTESGGASNCGTIFEVTTNGGFVSLVSFTGTNGPCLGESPAAGLVWGANGNLFGTTQYGGTNDLVNGPDGTIFEVTANGVFTSLISFSGANGPWLGANPSGTLVADTNGNLYGTTQYGGTNDSINSGDGTVFRITSAGVFTSLFSFNTTNGANPQAGLARGADGNYYGTTYYGGSNSLGTIFKMTPLGVLTILFTFDNANGANPYAGLVQGLDGNFYGTAKLGGASTCGTIFKSTPAGTFTSLASFANTNGAYPVAGLVQGIDGNFYGTTASGGTNFAYGTVIRFAPPPQFLKTWLTNGAFAFSWSAATGQVYQIQFITALGRTNWSNWPGTIPATNSIATALDAVGTNQQRFYRVALKP
jgi:uncharacterized repeat protein (TIGR03803 family)